MRRRRRVGNLRRGIITNPLRTSWIIWFTILLHLWWGIVLIVNPYISPDFDIILWSTFGRLQGHFFWGGLMISASLLAMISMSSRRRNLFTLSMMSLQQFVLAISSIDITLHVFGIYPIVTIIDFSYILIIAPLLIGLCILHTLAVLDEHDLINGK
jgi:hypothetical protein